MQPEWSPLSWWGCMPAPVLGTAEAVLGHHVAHPDPPARPQDAEDFAEHRPLSRYTVDLLRRWRRAQKEERTAWRPA